MPGEKEAGLRQKPGDVYKRQSRERERLANVLGRDPTVADLAQSMDLPEEQVVEALCAAAPPLSLTESDDDGGGQIDLPVASPEDMLSDVISLKQVCLLYTSRCV